MKQYVKVILLVTSVSLSTAFLTRLWLRYPDFFPPLPDFFWLWLVRFFNVGCCEEVADLELFVTVFVSFLIISVLTWSCMRFVPRFLKKKTA